MSCGLESPAGFQSVRIVIAPRLWRLNSLFIIVVLITGTRIRFLKELDMKFHDLNADRVSFVYNLMKFLMLT